MQVPDPTPDHIWNWRLNVAKGIELFNERVAAAGEYPSRVKNSEGFRNLVEQFNQRRQQQGLDPIQVVLPDFTTGNFDDDPQQLELDAIRGYNGWEGSDRFGFEMHEFRVAVDVVDGGEVLRVTDINEQTLIGEAVWEQVPVEDRLQNRGEPNYVNSVRAFAPNCLFRVPINNLIDHVFLMLDDFSKPLDWNAHIIGLHKEAQKINIQIEGKFLNLPSLTVQLTTRVANKESGATSVTPPKLVNVPKDNAASGANHTVYRLALTIADYDYPPTRSSILEVATIVRPGGTSDGFFREALGWAPRGIGTLPGAVGDVTGNEAAEVPDALQLLRAGGVEVLEAELIGLPADVIVLESKCSRLIRSPADIVYVSTHGLYGGNCVALDDTPANAHDSSYSCWSTSAALDQWNHATAQVAVGDTSNNEGREPTVLILAGCSLLTIKTSGTIEGPGLAWANLLHTKNGPLKAILGYRKHGREGGAPKDSSGGNVIALAMGTIIAERGGALNYVQAWLKINMAAKALRAVGIDKDGYWWMERKDIRFWKVRD